MINIISELLAEENSTNFMDISIAPNNNFSPVELPYSEQPARIYLASLANGSHPTMMSALNQMASLMTTGLCDAETMPWQAVGLPHADAIRAWLMQNKAASTGNRYLSALRGTMKACWKLGQITTDHWMRVVSVASIKSRRLDQADERMISTGEFNSMIRVCMDSKHKSSGLRDACILGCSMYIGMRSKEIASMLVSDYNLLQGQITITGKRRVTRKVEVIHGLGLALAEWMEYRNPEGKHMFQHVNRGGNVQPSGITSTSIQNAFVKRAKEAGITDIKSHDGRRTFISTLLDHADVSVVQKTVGHASANTTAGYDRRGTRARAAAMGNLHMEWGTNV